MRRSLTLSGVTHGNRYDMTAAVSGAITGAGGWIIDHALFSNVAACIRFAVPARGLAGFRDRILAAGFALDAESLDAIGAAVPADPVDTELTVALNLTFVHDEPDLRRTVPAIPG